jgi:murein DD-endopeptidase MepM/ murein hydrolase activator NlpD
MVVPDGGGAARTYKITRKRIRLYAIAVAVPLVICAALGLTLALVLGQASVSNTAAAELAKENFLLRGRLSSVAARVATIDRRLKDVRLLDEKLRSITMLNDPDRNLDIGPVTKAGDKEKAPKFDDGVRPYDGAATRLAKRAKIFEVLDMRADMLAGEALERERSLRELEDYFYVRRHVMAATPSIWPTRGYVTSEFRARIDEATGRRKMHPAIDISAPVGTAVRSPADGVVAFAEEHYGYGKTIKIDHGNGITTIYGHLSRYEVKVGQKLTRGDKIGEVGNTGRSTGPHLHYEVRLHGIPVNPRRYILD